MYGDESIERGSRHPQQVARVRVGVAIWLLVMTAVLYGSGHGAWWEALLVALAALHFYLAYRAPRATRAKAGSIDA